MVLGDGLWRFVGTVGSAMTALVVLLSTIVLELV